MIATDAALTNVAGLAGLVSLWLFIMGKAFRSKQEWCSRLALIAFTITFIGITGALVFRGLQAARFPTANLYESLVLFAWSLTGVYLYIAWRYRDARFGVATALAVCSIFLFCSWLPESQRTVMPLMPALVSNWRVVHVPPLMISYALFLCGGASAVAYLWTQFRRKTTAALAGAILVSFLSIALGLSHALAQNLLHVIFWVGSIFLLILAAFFLQQERQIVGPDMPKARMYDEISHRCITLGFPLLTFGIISGALWANHAWGTYWSWDPKESMSLVTWLTYAIYMHLRTRSGRSNDAVAVVAVLGLLLTLLTYLGFNVLGFGGLHSYGKID